MNVATPFPAATQSPPTPAARVVRVCHLTYSFFDNDNRVMRYAETLANRGDQVDVIGLRRRGQVRVEVSHGVHVYRIQRRTVSETSRVGHLLKILWFLLKASAAVTVLQIRRGYDVIHVHNVPDFLVFACWLPRLMGTRIILDIHDLMPELYCGKFGARAHGWPFGALLLAERISCYVADHVIVSNHLWWDKLAGRAVPRTKCTALMNYPDLSIFKPTLRSREPGDRFVFLYPGTLNHHQGVDIAVRAFARVMDAMPRAEFHIYGEGPAKLELSRLCLELGVAGRVKLRDRVPLREVAEVIASADAGIVPKRTDGFGDEAFSTKVLEFMASGVPVVLSRTRVDTYYFDETLVRFFEPGNEEDLAKALVDVYTIKNGHVDWAERARRFARCHSWQEHEADYLHIVDGLAAHVSSPLLRRGAAG